MTCLVDLTLAPYGVVADNPAAAAANTSFINQAIVDLSGTFARLALPAGEIYLDRANGTHNWSILFGTGISDLALVGRGMFTSTLVIQGRGGHDWHGIFVNGAQRIELADFAIRHGRVVKPDEETHLITILNPRRGGPTQDIVGHHLFFGQAIGDGLRILGDTAPVTNVQFTHFVMHLGGIGKGARSGIAMQRGWRFVELGNFTIDGVRNSAFDVEPSGSAAMEHLNVHDAVIDHRESRSDNAVAIAGLHKGEVPQASHLRFSRLTVLGGSVKVSWTRDLTISDLTVLTAPRTQRPVLKVDEVNLGLVMRDLELERSAGGVDGHVLHLENRGGPTRVERGTFTQMTSGYPILAESTSDLHINGSEIRYLAPSGSTDHDGIRIVAKVGNANNVSITDVHLKTGARRKLRSAVCFAAAKDQQMFGIRVADVVSAGAAATGLLLSFHPATKKGDADRFPFMSGLDNGTDRTWRQVDQNDNPITSVCPAIAGNRHHVSHMIGETTPENVAVAYPGSTFTFENGNATQHFVKLAGTGNTGWSAPLLVP
jgi:hypothetical protein